MTTMKTFIDYEKLLKFCTFSEFTNGTKHWKISLIVPLWNAKMKEFIENCNLTFFPKKCFSGESNLKTIFLFQI